MLRDKHRGEILRPFVAVAGVGCRGYSQLLQRAITDFGADAPFWRVAEKLEEHYGLKIPINAGRRITEAHARELTTEAIMPVRRESAEALTLIAEIDGSMIPIVDTGIETGTDPATVPSDARKRRRVRWKEAKLSLVRRCTERSTVYGATTGDAQAAGEVLRQLAVSVGLSSTSRVHGLGDGAPWIAEQFEQQFGAQASYLIDLYHVCDYLAPAAGVCGDDNPRGWVNQQKERLKSGELAAVLAALELHLEPEHIVSKDAPVRACYRYLSNRPAQLDYAAAIAQKLPIGSGEIESAHRHIIQDRLKRSGAWWTEENAQAMLNLKTLRANGGWERYWQQAQALAT